MAVGTMPIKMPIGMRKYGPCGPYRSLANDQVTALLFSACKVCYAEHGQVNVHSNTPTCPDQMFVPAGSRRTSRCEVTTDVITTVSS